MRYRPAVSVRCPCGNVNHVWSDAVVEFECQLCRRALRVPPVPAPAGQTGSMPAGEAALVEVNKLAQRMTVLEGRVDELCRALRAAQTAPAAAPPANKGYWR